MTLQEEREAHKVKIKYRCSTCGNTIPYGSESAIQGEHDDIFCSQECLWNWYGFEKFDWSTHPEYYKYTKEEWLQIRKKYAEERAIKEKEEEAERNKHDLKQVESAINELLTDNT